MSILNPIYTHLFDLKKKSEPSKFSHHKTHKSKQAKLPKAPENSWTRNGFSQMYRPVISVRSQLLSLATLQRLYRQEMRAVIRLFVSLFRCNLSLFIATVV